MALSALRSGFWSSTPKLIRPMNIIKPQVATIISKQLRDPDYKRATPFDYKNKKFSYMRGLFDTTTHRFDENSKIIVVDGAIASGKSKLAKEIAEQLDMIYLSAPNFDDLYVNSYGYDLRQLNSQLCDKVKCLDLVDFLKNPNHPLTPRIQFCMFRLKLKQYLDALKHILNTGQGVVLDTSVYSDTVFIETLLKFGFIDKKAHKYLMHSRQQTVTELMKPHLVIYLDLPVDEVLKRIEQRNLPQEKNSPFYKPEILAYLEKMYKQNYLPEINKHAEILIYDWAEHGESDLVVDDIEFIDFDNYEHTSSKMKDWVKVHEDAWQNARYLYTTYDYYFDLWSEIPELYVPSLVWQVEEEQNYHDVVSKAPGEKYAPGYNEDQGDKGILFKWER